MMNQFMQWLGMGGYSISIWPADGLVCTVLVVNLLGIKRQRIRTRKILQQWFKHETRT